MSHEHKVGFNLDHAQKEVTLQIPVWEVAPGMPTKEMHQIVYGAPRPAAEDYVEADISRTKTQTIFNA